MRAHGSLNNDHGSKFKLGTHARCRIARMAEYCESSRFSKVGDVSHQPEHHIFPRRQFGMSKVVWVALFKDHNLFETLSYFFMYVSVSNLHFPQMKMVSEKPQEAVLGRNFSGRACPQSPPHYGMLYMLSLIPYGNLAGQVFSCFLQPWSRNAATDAIHLSIGICDNLPHVNNDRWLNKECQHWLWMNIT